MQNLTHLKVTTEGRAMEAIFDACRDNPNREPKGRVTFTANIMGGHEAALRDESGMVVALADVDEND